MNTCINAGMGPFFFLSDNADLKMVTHQFQIFMICGGFFHFCLTVYMAFLISKVKDSTDSSGKPSQVCNTFPPGSSNRVYGNFPCELYLSAISSFTFCWEAEG